MDRLQGCTSSCALKISSILHRFQSFDGGLDHLLQMYAPHYSTQSRWDIHFFQLFPFSAIQHSGRNAYCQQQQEQHRCLIAGIFWLKSMNPFFKTHSHITLNSENAKQSCPCGHMWFTEHCLHHILCVLQMTSIAKKVDHAGECSNHRSNFREVIYQTHH